MNRTSETLSDVAQIARVSGSRQLAFVRLVQRAIEEAKKDSKRPAHYSSADDLYRAFYRPIILKANSLLHDLERLNGLHLAIGEDSVAAAFYFNHARPPRSLTDAEHDGIVGFIASTKLESIIAVAKRASDHAKRTLSKKGRKLGTANPAFDLFVTDLLAICERGGGKLTIYRTSYENKRWAGPLLTVMTLLRPHLPQQNFWPKGAIGYSLNTVYRRWLRETPNQKKRRNGTKKKMNF